MVGEPEKQDDLHTEMPEDVRAIIEDTEIGKFIFQNADSDRKMLEELPCDEYCPDDRRTCDGYLTPGASEPMRCPLDDMGECPHAEERRVYHQQRRLRAAGFGKRYVQCNYTWNLVYARVRPTIREFCNDITTNLHEGRGLILGGPTEAGKTCCLALIALATPADVMVRYITLAQLFGLVHSDRQRADQVAKGSDLLLLDEVGAAYSDRHAQAMMALDEYISYRHADLRSTCIATNMRHDTMREQMQQQSPGIAERVLSRLAETNQFCSFAGAPKLRQSTRRDVE